MTSPTPDWQSRLDQLTNFNPSDQFRASCIFCKAPTNFTYRDHRHKDENLNLINCCPTCAKTRDYLSVSSCHKPLPKPATEPETEPTTTN